jgi:SAM-dependent methyltransferase
MSNNISFFQCLFCNGRQVEISDTAWQCLQCSRDYPVIQGIPLLLHNWKSHETDMANRRQSRPQWHVDEQLPEHSGPWRHHLRKRRLYVQKVIASYLQNNGRHQATTLLDLGCGDGSHFSYLSPYAQLMYGSDYNLLRLFRARSASEDVLLFTADILRYPAGDNFFEVIFCNHVIEHIADDMAALATMHRILKPGGILVLGTPNEGAWWWQLAYRLQPHTLKDTDHLHFYTATGITRKLLASDFQIVETKHLGWGLPHWGADQCCRKHKFIDDLFETLGSAIFPNQASSLYIVASKP